MIVNTLRWGVVREGAITASGYPELVAACRTKAEAEKARRAQASNRLARAAYSVVRLPRWVAMERET